MNQVNDKWDYFMFKQAHNWEDLTIPEEVKMKLAGNHKTEDEAGGRSWVSLMSMGVESDF
jgi:hypothetical protein